MECIAGNYDVAVAIAGDNCGCGYQDACDNEFAAIAFDDEGAHLARLVAWMGALPAERREVIEASRCTRFTASPSGGQQQRVASARAVAQRSHENVG